MKDQIKRYHELGPEERLRVELFVEEHPEYRPLLERHRRFVGALHRAGSPRPDLTDDDLARYVTRGEQQEGEPPHVKAEYERISRLVEQDAAVREEAQSYSARYDELQSAFDPVSHFESLAGGDEPERSGAGEPKLSYVARPPAEPRRLTRVIRWSASIAAGLAVLVASLVAIDAATSSGLERASAFSSDELDRRQYTFTLRSNDVIAFTTADSLFISALDALISADRSFFGLFRSYDARSLAEARHDLENVIALEGEDAFLALEARYLLAKIMIQEGRLSEAETYLQNVVREGGTRSDRASLLLTAIEDAE